jgi:RNA-binding protein YhbY
VPTPAQLPRHRVGSTLDPSWATADGEAGSAARRQRRGRGRDAASAPPSAAELALPRNELRRLQGIGIKVRKRLKVGKAGITEGIVNGIHERWRNTEVVKIRFEDVWAMNMRRTHEMLEVSAPCNVCSSGCACPTTKLASGIMSLSSWGNTLSKIGCCLILWCLVMLNATVSFFSRVDRIIEFSVYDHKILV